MARKRYLIIGDGAAGTTAAQYVRLAEPQAAITILSDDPSPAYFRAALTNYLLGELREDQIWAVPPTFYAEHGVQRVLTRVASVDTARGVAWLANGAAEAYDALLVAAGSRARPPTWDGAWLPGVMTMRTLQDVRRVMDLIKLHGMQRAVVVGGGPLALEWAQGMRARGVKVTMVVRENKFLPGALDAVGSDLLLARLRQAGVDVRVGDQVRAAVPGRDGRVAGAMLQSGETIACELIAAAIGVICNSDFLQGTPIALGKSGGVVVDDRLRTTVRNVYAAGDIAEVGGRLSQLWEPARLQGRTAATNLIGGDVVYAPGVHYMATRLYDLDFASLGVTSAQDGAEEIVDYPRHTGRISYKKLVIKNGKLIGAMMLGEREEKVRARGRAWKRLIDEGRDIANVKGLLLDASFDVTGWLNTTALTAKPDLAPQAALASPSKMKGTQAINLAELVPAKKAPDAAPLASPARMMGTQALDFSMLPPSPDARAPAARVQSPASATASVAKGTQLVPGAPRGLTPAAAPGPRPEKKLAFGTMLLAMDGPPLEAEPGTAAGGAWLEASGRRWELGAHASSIGRDPQSAIALTDPQVSHLHAQITRHGDELYLRDLGSASGTWVNGQPVTVPHRLREGDRVRFGGVELLFRTASGRRSTALPDSMQNADNGERKPHLDVRAGSGLGLSFVLAQPEIAIGRNPSSGIRLDDYSVAWNHGLLRLHGGQYWLRDQGMSEGVWRNGQRLAPQQDVALQENDVLRFGEAQLVFVTKPVAAGHPSLATRPPSTAPPPAVAYTPAPAMAMQAIAPCARCGVPLDPQATFCTSCGVPARAKAAP